MTQCLGERPVIGTGRIPADPKAEALQQWAPRASKAACVAWRLCYDRQPGEEIRRHKTRGKRIVAQLPWQREKSQSRWSRRGMQTDFFALSVRKTLPSGKRGRKLLPHDRKEVGAVAAPSRGVGSREVTPGLWDVADPSTQLGGWQKRGGSRSPKWQRGGICRQDGEK